MLNHICLGYLVAGMLRGNGLMIGGQESTGDNPPPLPNQPLPPINLRNTIYIPMVIPINNYSEDEDPDLQEAIRQSLES